MKKVVHISPLYFVEGSHLGGGAALISRADTGDVRLVPTMTEPKAQR